MKKILMMVVLIAGCSNDRPKEYIVKESVVVKTEQRIPLKDGGLLVREGTLTLNKGNVIRVMTNVVEDKKEEEPRHPETMARK